MLILQTSLKARVVGLGEETRRGWEPNKPAELQVTGDLGCCVDLVEETQLESWDQITDGQHVL